MLKYFKVQYFEASLNKKKMLIFFFAVSTFMALGYDGPAFRYLIA